MRSGRCDRRRVILVGDVHTVRHQYVKMRIEIERGVKPLHEAHRATTSVGGALLFGLPPIPSPARRGRQFDQRRGLFFGTVPFELDYLPADEDHVKHPSDAYDAERRERRWEKRASKKSALSPEEQRLITLQQNYFSFVALEDACHPREQSLTASYDGSHPLLIVDRNNTLMADAAQLARLMHPDVAVRGQLEGTQSLVDWRRAANMIGFETELTAADLF
jgi:hypothetical protein